VILLTAWTHLDAAVDLIKAGAADYLAKPWDDRKLVTTVENLIELGRPTANCSGACSASSASAASWRRSTTCAR
jgi:FixJ family two-component response regulator